MRALFIQHDHVSPLGPVGERFAHHGFDIDTHLVVPEESFASPNIATSFPAAADYDVLIPLGAPWGAWDDACIGRWLLPEIAWLGDAVRSGMPVLGICFGGQLLARALGGSVAPAPRGEIGWTSVWSDDPALVGEGPWFQFHYDRWVVPPGAVGGSTGAEHPRCATTGKTRTSCSRRRSRPPRRPARARSRSSTPSSPTSRRSSPAPERRRERRSVIRWRCRAATPQRVTDRRCSADAGASAGRGARAGPRVRPRAPACA